MARVTSVTVESADSVSLDAFGGVFFNCANGGGAALDSFFFASLGVVRKLPNGVEEADMNYKWFLFTIWFCVFRSYCSRRVSL